MMGLQSASRRLLGLGAVLAVGSILGVLGGVPGLLFGATAVVVWLTTPPVFAFVLAQSGIAAVTSSPATPLVVVAELALLTMLLSDTRLDVSTRPIGGALLGVAVVAVGLWVMQPVSLWLTALGSLLGVSGLIYGVHRYELLATGQLSDE